MSVIDEVKERVDIVDLIGAYVRLQKAGQSFKGLCPFHAEKTPSFIVFPETQTWHCFGACSTGGDIFSFIMRQENVEFGEALKMLAERAGVELRPLDEAEIAFKDELDRLRAINQEAAQFYHHLLMDAAQGEAARRYLERRGVTRETMAAFQLGYAPDAWHDLGHALTRAGFKPDEALEAGLTVKNEAGNVYDRFRHRLMFPIRDAQGRVIGFGGRVLDDSLPKYLNSPQTPLFDKGAVLYGIDLARQAIKQSGVAIVVEGYMDVVIPHQCGVQNLVACMGTALTDEHLRVLKPITKTLILALDPDAAGLAAVEKGAAAAQQGLERKVTPVLAASGLVRYEERLSAEIRVLALPDGLDPDELILRDRARWDKLLAEALPVADHFFRVALEGADLVSAKGKRAVVNRLLPVIAALDSPVERAHYLQRLAQAVRVDERLLTPELDRLRGVEGASGPAARARRQPSPPESAPAQPAANDALGLEERSLALLLEAPDLLAEALELSRLSADALQDTRNRQVFEWLAAGQTAPPDAVGARQVAPLVGGPDAALTLDSALQDHVESLRRKLRAGPPLSREMLREDLLKCLMRLRKNHLSRLIRELRFMQQDAHEQNDAERSRELNALIEQLGREYLDTDQRSYAVTLTGRRRSSATPGHGA